MIGHSLFKGSYLHDHHFSSLYHTHSALLLPLVTNYRSVGLSLFSSLTLTSTLSLLFSIAETVGKECLDSGEWNPYVDYKSSCLQKNIREMLERLDTSSLRVHPPLYSIH